MSCTTGFGEFGQLPGTRWPCSSRNTSASPLRACRLVKIFRHYDAFGVRPRTGADTTARVGRLVTIVGISLRAQVGVPSLVAESDAARQVLTNLIRSAQPAQVCCLAASASDKEAHGRIGLSAFSAHALGVVTADYAQCCHRREKKSLVLHKKFPFLSIRYFLSGEFLDADLATSGNLFFQIKITFSKRD